MKIQKKKISRKIALFGAAAIILISAITSIYFFSDLTDTSAETSVSAEKNNRETIDLFSRADIDDYLYEKNWISVTKAKNQIESRIRLALQVHSVGSRISAAVVLPDRSIATGVAFKFLLGDSENVLTEYIDEDMDGQIVIEDLKKGMYVLSLSELKGVVLPDPVSISVEGEVAFVPVADIVEKVVSEESIVVADEDAAFGNVTVPETTVPETAAPETTVQETTVTPETGSSSNQETSETSPPQSFLTGWQTIDGLKHFYNNEGIRVSKAGVDVSKYQGNIDWNAVKAAGVDFAMIRLGFRGYGSGALVLDSYYLQNIRGAEAAGLSVGVYFFSQAITETEAVEEASMVLQYVRGYHITCPIAFDTEFVDADARANNLSASDRTTIALAFLQTIENSGYTASLYANKSFLYNQLELSRLSGYQTWLAHYVSMTDYAYDYKMWQYTDRGMVNGISTGVDLNVWLDY